MPSQSLNKDLSQQANESIGLILIDDQARVLGMSARAMQILEIEPGRLGQSVLDYHGLQSRAKVNEFLRLSQQANPEAPVAMIIDVLGKVITIALAPLIMASSQETPYRIATITDVTQATGAVVEPASGQVRLSRFPVCQDGSFIFLDSASIFYFRSDGNYCRIYTEQSSHYVLMTLKHVLQRYTGPQFFRVHKSYVVNLEKMRELKLKDGGQAEIIFDSSRVNPVPVARRRLPELKMALGL